MARAVERSAHVRGLVTYIGITINNEIVCVDQDILLRVTVALVTKTAGKIPYIE
jgi:hypothetical protein